MSVVRGCSDLTRRTKLDVSGIYKRGGADIEAEQLAREAVIEALPIEEQRRIYELFCQAGLRAAAGDLSPNPPSQRQ
jgi:hypothetical protein